METEWTGRLLRCAASAAWNMALDESLLNGSRSEGPVVLRLYGWKRPAVTLGRFQDAARAVDLDLCRQRGIEVVRRPTGGRAVYHVADLTYSLLFPETAAGGRSIRESYRLIADALSRAFCQAGLNLRQGAPDRASIPSRSDCFAHLSLADLALAGRKFIGSAQMRRGGWVLQQGSIRAWSMETPSEIFYSKIPANVGPEDDLKLTRSLVERAIAEELAALFRCQWQEDHLADWEEENASRLVTQKYATEGWTLSGECIPVDTSNRPLTKTGESFRKWLGAV